MEDPLVGQIIAAEALKRMPRVAPSAGELPARGKNTAGYVKKMGAELAPDFPLREVVKPVVAPDTPAELALKELQARTLKRLETKPDYSGLEGINYSRAEMGAPEVGAGLYMSILGGKHMKEAGGTMLKEALKNREPIRPNAADIGWTDPATGKVVENPMLRETRDTAVIQHQLDQAIKTREFEITEARRLGDQALAEQKHQELKILLAQRQGSTIIHNNLQDEAAMVRAQNAGANKEDALTNEQRNKVAAHDADIATVSGALAAAEKAQHIFGFKRGLPGAVAGQLGETLAGRKDNPVEAEARARVYNEVAALVKSRAGTAESAREGARILTYAPGPTDTYDQVKNKLQAYQRYLQEKRGALNVVVPKHPGGDRRANDRRTPVEEVIPEGAVRERK